MSARTLRASLVALVAACGAPSDDTGNPDTSLEPLATEVGSPDGEVSRATIGPEGGTVTSADGAVRVEIPAGALGADTEISVGPITDTSVGGLGRAWRLGPDGQTFDQPVTLSFAFDADDLGGGDAGALGVAWQQDDGTWSWLPGPEADAERVSATTTHFTDFSLVRGFQLTPASAKVGAGQSKRLRLVVCYPASLDEELVPLGYPCGGDTDEDASWPVYAEAWSVNGVAGGSDATGTVSGDGRGATFLAPAKIPDPATVAVSANVPTGGRGKVLVVSNLEITEAVADYTGEATFEAEGLGLFNGTVTVTWTERERNTDSVAYVASGTMTATYESFDCVPVTVTAPILSSAPDESWGVNSHLLVQGPGAGDPNTYDFTISSVVQYVDLQCGQNDGSYTLEDVPVLLYAYAGPCTDGPLTYDDAERLSGRYDCPGSNQVTTWTFVAP